MWSEVCIFIAAIASQGSFNPVCNDSIPTGTPSSLDEAEQLRLQYRLLMEQKNKPGSISADFKFIGRDNQPNSLHSIKTDSDILLIFYDPDCDDCHDTITRISESDLPQKLSIVAIDAEEDRERWNQTASYLPENWTVGFALDPIQDNETYYILSMPTIYLLDKDKKVILKDTSLEEVLNLY